jgi:amidohydrolase
LVDFIAEADELFEYTRDLRRDFHKHPEIGFEEFRTAGIVAEELNKLNIEVSTGVAETGVVAIIEGGKPGPVVLCRFDMDALPINEETNAEYASVNDGLMHACGHDGHTAIGLGLAKLLHKNKEALNGTVKLVFQPAEEGMGGAEKMVAEGVLENPRPDYSLGLHVWNTMPVGKFGITAGPIMAAAETMQIKIKGKGAHGAKPNEGIDPIVAASQIILGLQTIVSRNVDPKDTAVISVTAINGGTAFNIIPPEVEILGTIRSYSPETREILLRRIDEVVTGIAASMECEAEVKMTDITPVVDNDDALTHRIQDLATDLFSADKVVSDERTMGSEDMSFLMKDIPSCFVFVGSQNKEKGFHFGHHHPKFDIDEKALRNGLALMASTVFDLLS